MKLLYKPFAIIAGILGTILGKRAFRSLWSKIDSSGSSPPPPRTGEASLLQVAAGAAIQGATLAAIAASVDRLMATTFHHLFGAWPEKPQSDQDQP